MKKAILGLKWARALSAAANNPSIFGGVRGIVSTLDDVRIWMGAVGRRDLFSPASGAEQLDMVPIGEGLGIHLFRQYHTGAAMIRLEKEGFVAKGFLNGETFSR